MDEHLLRLVEVPYWGAEPVWMILLAALVLFLLVIVILVLVPVRRLILGAVAIGLVAGAIGGGAYGLHQLDHLSRVTERRALEERASVLFTQTIQPGSVFACVDGSPAPAMLEACERTLFVEPQRVAAAVALVTQRVAFLADAIQFGESRDARYLERILPMRNAMEADPYGFVAYVLATEFRCTPEQCERFAMLRDPTRVKENMRARRFEAFMVKHASVWRESSEELPAADASAGRASAGAIVPGVSVDAQSTAPEIGDPSPPLVPEPTAAAAPAVAPAEPAPSPPAPAAAAKGAPKGEAKAAAKGETKGTPKGEAKGAKGEAKAAPKGDAKGPARAAAKSKADPAFRRTPEPVAGLPRVVPRDYVRDEEPAEPTPPASGRAGAPTSIVPPAQNFQPR